MTMASIDEQIAVWNGYCEAKRRADKTLNFEDGVEAIRAWKQFANLYFPEDRQLPLTQQPRKVAIFPIHKTQAPGEKRP